MNHITDKPVIVPWDFSDQSKQALDKAIELVGSPDQITVVHVTPYPPATEYSVIWGTYNEDQIRDNLTKSFRKEMPDDIPEVDEYMVAVIRAAGAIVIGKSNVPEFGAGANSTNPVYGTTGNPFDPALTCGGSSGGSAVALATSMVPLATGSDTGGSIHGSSHIFNQLLDFAVYVFNRFCGPAEEFVRICFDLKYCHLRTKLAIC